MGAAAMAGAAMGAMYGHHPHGYKTKHKVRMGKGHGSRSAESSAGCVAEFGLAGMWIGRQVLAVEKVRSRAPRYEKQTA